MNWKKIVSAMLCIVIVFGVLPLNVFAQTTVTIHYQREDGNYDGWQVWGWEEGKDGANYLFDDVDEYGAVATITLDNDQASKVGFIVKREDWTKDVDEDRYIDILEGDEIWVSSGVSEFSYENPNGGSEKEAITFDLNIDYEAYDNEYSDLVFGYTLKDSDTIVEVRLVNGKATTNITTNGNIKFSIYKYDQFSDYVVSKESQIVDYVNGVVPISKVENGELNIYLLKNSDNISYGNAVDKSITTAKIESTDYIDVYTNYPIIIATPMKLFENGEDVKVEKIEPIKYVVGNGVEDVNYSTGFRIITSENIDLSKTYTVKIDGFEESTVGLGNVYDSEDFERLYTYTGDDLGLTIDDKINLRVWSPVSQEMYVEIYDNGNSDNKLEQTLPMQKAENGTWTISLDKNNINKYYRYKFSINGVEDTAVDPYAKAVGVNGNFGQLIDVSDVIVEGFDPMDKPELKSMSDSIIYELHVRDLSMDEDSNIVNKGKFLGLVETGTKNADGLSTGIDHIKEMGVTHVHLLPSYDYKTVDESGDLNKQFNWGYDPQNYNVPEGSYSTDPYNGEVRVNEFKQMVDGMHDNGLRVVMDVVYNHTFSADSNLNKLVPNYYYRLDANGNFSNGSGCGNETASERSMMRKLMVDSVTYWATEYGIDGFRFDLMAVHDIETMNIIREELDKIDPSIIVYGEGWTGGTVQLSKDKQALKENAKQLNNIAVFSDDIRDGIKGSVFNVKDRGFVSGSRSKDEDIKFGVVGSVDHDGVNIDGVDYSTKFWANNPTQTINYASAHDNLTLWDKLSASTGATEEELLAMNKLSAVTVLTSQGIPFFKAGEEFARSKNGDENSYKSSDEINKLDWSRKTEYSDLVEYYKGLIALRKANGAFSLETGDEVRSNLTFMETTPQVVAYTLKGVEGDMYNEFIVILNGSNEDVVINVEDRVYDVLVNNETAGTKVVTQLTGTDINVTKGSALVVGVNNGEVVESDTTKADSKPSSNTVLIGSLLVLCAAFFISKANKEVK